LRLLADGLHGLQDFGRGGARFQPALGGELVDQAVGQRITERHAQLQHVNAELVELKRELACGLKVWIACPI